MRDSSVNGYVQEGLQALRAKQHARAAKAARRALAGHKDHPLALLILGVAQHGLGAADALTTLERAVARAPDDPQFHYNYAVTLADCGEPELAMVAYRACLGCDPDFPDALWNYGEMLRLREHFAPALACFDRLEQCDGRSRPKMPHRMAVCCAHLPGMEARADELFRRQLAEDDDPHSHWEYALYLLGQGRDDDAWPHHARRFDAGDKISVHKARFDYADWNGQFEADATLLIHGEQGAGDEILFAAFLPGLIERAQATGMALTLACRPALRRLFQASFPGIRVLNLDSGRPEALRQAVSGPIRTIAIGDLPLHIARPEPTAYLRPHSEDVTPMRQVLAATRTPATTRRIGVIWQANPAVARSNRVSRNLPPQLLNARAAAIQGLRWFSLQPAEHRASLARLADLDIVDLSPWLTDFSRTAALMQAMDCVVTVCTSTANLAGSLGVDTRVLLQRHADWRWHHDRAWYPNVTSYRQRVSGDWSEPLQALLADLQTLPSVDRQTNR